MLKVQCDKCLKIDEAYNMDIKTVKINKENYKGLFKGELYKIDLCDECIKDLKNYLKGDKKC